ncbi:hypothetical protein JNK13_06840 [bacterium]|nr:hypothetical protein [bacterium]
MKKYLSDWPFRIGLILFIFGSGPLIAIIILAELEIWSDPNPNPVRPGLLCALTLWPR